MKVSTTVIVSELALLCIVVHYQEGIVAIGNPERHVHKASHRGSKQQ